MKQPGRRRRDQPQSPAAPGLGGRSVAAGGDISGIASTGDHVVNVQYRAERMTVLPAEAGTPGHVFISYVREDAERVDRLQRAFDDAGISVWRDTADLWPGQDWKLEIRRAITTGSLAFVACFSEHSQRRVVSYQNEELILAVQQMRARPPGRVWLLPVRFADCQLPEFDLGSGRTLDSLQRTDLFDDRSWDRGVARLITAVRGVLTLPR